MSRLYAVLLIVCSLILTVSGVYSYYMCESTIKELIAKLIIANVFLIFPIIVKMFNLNLKFLKF